MKLAVTLALKILDIAADYFRARRLARQMQAMHRTDRRDAEYDPEVDAVLQDLGIIHHGGRNPTTKITIKPKHEQGKPVGITAESES
jgi:hypothetical protein